MSKATGVTRGIDSLGRVVIPKSLRTKFGLNENDNLEFFIGDNNEIILKKYQVDCIFCGETDNLVEYKNKKVCKNCLRAISEV